MALNNNHVTGFVIGLGAAAAGFYLYRQNQVKVDSWLRSQGIDLGSTGGRDHDKMSMEELVTEKEHLEDIIAEREMAAQENTASDEPAPEAG